MRLVCGSCSADFEASQTSQDDAATESSPRCRACGRPPHPNEATARSGSKLTPRECWFVQAGERREGPFSAADFSRGLARGELNWSNEVWREGLPDFRAARRDELLVLGVARVRGLGEATVRLDGLPSLLQSSATQLVMRPTSEPRPVSTERPAPGTLLEARRVTTLDATPSPIRASVAPAQPARSSLPPAAEKPRRPSRAPLWIAAFVVGALAALGPGPLRTLVALLPTVLPRAPTRPAPIASAPVSNPAPLAPAPRIDRIVVERVVTAALPAPEVLRAALKSASPRVYRCLRHPEQGLSVELALAGNTGRVRDVAVSEPLLRAGELECVHDALSDVRVEPFREPAFTVKHHFAW